MANKKLALGAIVLLSFFCLLPETGRAVESNSYYQSQLHIGEHISSINNQLNLDYRGTLADYQISTSLKISKEHRFLDLKYKQGFPFLEGLIREEERQFDDYLLSIRRKRAKLDLGLVNPKAGSSFLHTGQMLGGYLKLNDYQLWSGYSQPEGLGLSSRNNLQWGVNYQQEKRQVTYQALQEEKTYNQYLSYSDNFSWGNTYVSINTTTGFNLTDQLVGLANDIRVNSRIKDVSYTVSADYSAPDFAAVNNRFDVGYGNYGVNLHTHKQFGSYLLSSKLGYTRNNLNQKADTITRDWINNWQLKYYVQPDISYYSKLNYNLQNTYQTDNSSLTDRENNIEAEVGAKLKDLSLNLSHSQTIKQDTVTNSNISLGFDYNPQLSSLTGSYNWEKQEAWTRNFNLNFSYNKDITNNINYSLSFNLAEDEQMKIGLNQGLRYNFFSNQSIDFKLALDKARDQQLNKSGYLQYQYRF